MLAVLTHSPVKFSGKRHPGSTNFERTGFNRILSGAYENAINVNHDLIDSNIFEL